MALTKINLSHTVYNTLKQIHDKTKEVYSREENFNQYDASFSAVHGAGYISMLPLKPGGREIPRQATTSIEKLAAMGIFDPNELTKCGVWQTVTSLQRANFVFHRHSVYSDDGTIQFDNLLVLPFVEGCYQIANPKDKTIAPILKPSGFYTSSKEQLAAHAVTGDFLDELHGDEDDVENIFTLNVKPGDAVLLDTSIFHKFKSDNMFPSMAIFCPMEPDFEKAKQFLENL